MEFSSQVSLEVIGHYLLSSLSIVILYIHCNLDSWSHNNNRLTHYYIFFSLLEYPWTTREKKQMYTTEQKREFSKDAVKE